MIYLLGWISGCDGNFHEKEKLLFKRLSEALLRDSNAVDRFRKSFEGNDTYEILKACRQLAKSVDPTKAHLIFELALSMAMADSVFSVGENHVIRFISDALGLTRTQYEASFQTVTGRIPTEPGDLSSAQWWQERDRIRDEQKEQDRQNTATSSIDRQQAESLKMLFLEPTATMKEIKSAFRRLAKTHHPDRFEGLGNDVVETASISFRRIREAYEYLIR